MTLTSRSELDYGNISRVPYTPAGHVSLPVKIGHDVYRQAMLQMHDSFDGMVEKLPKELRNGVREAYNELDERSRKNRVYEKDLKTLERNVGYYLEAEELENRLIEKEKKLCGNFTRGMPLDYEAEAEAHGNYAGTQDYREKFKKAVESDSLLYQRLEKMNRELGFNSNGVGLAKEVLYTNLSLSPSAPLDRKSLVREILGKGAIFQSGEFPVKHKRGTDIVPVEEEKEEHPNLKKYFAIGTAAISIGTVAGVAIHGQVVHRDAGYHFKQAWNSAFGPKDPGGGTDPGSSEPSEPPLDNYSRWKMEHFGTTDVPDSGDYDSDGLENMQEYEIGTNPAVADTDGDGMTDAREVKIPFLNPLEKDSYFSKDSQDLVFKVHKYADGGVDELELVYLSLLNNISRRNPEAAAVLLATDSLFNDGKISPEEANLVAKVSKLGELEDDFYRLPEFYTGETGNQEALKYADLLSKVQEKSPDAAKLIVQSGLLLKDKKISALEQRFVENSLGKVPGEDLLRLYVSREIAEGIDSSEYRGVDIFGFLNSFSPRKSEKLSYLSNDVDSLPEIRDGVSPEEQAALQKLGGLVNASMNDYELRKGIALIDEYGKPDGKWFDFPVPSHNTQAQSLFWLLKDRDVPEKYFRTALGIASDYGSLVTIGNDEVDREVRDYQARVLDFVIETDEILRQKNIEWNASGYPLEAQIGLVWRSNANLYPWEVGTDENQPSWWYAFNKIKGSPMGKEDFDWLMADHKTMEEIRDWMLDKGFADLTVSDDAVCFESEFRRIMIEDKGLAEKDFDINYRDNVDKIAMKLNDYFFFPPGGPSRGGHFSVTTRDDKETIDGKEIYLEDIPNPDWQWKNFKKNDVVKGCCVDDALIESLAFRSINRPSLMGISPHAFNLYWNARDGVWRGPPAQAMPRGSFLGYGYGGLPFDNFFRDSNSRQFGNFFMKTESEKAFLKGVPVGYILRGRN